MRLIDADALHELIDGGFDLNFDEVPETKRELLRMVDEQPTIQGEKGRPMRVCGNCDYNDGCTYTSLPPQYKCTLTGEFHFGNEPCDVDFVPVIRCKDCKHRKTYVCPLYESELNEWECDFKYYDHTEDDGYCYKGEKKDDD